MSNPMDIQPLSRKELQALCKSHGIPANKTNAFMMEALVKKRVPLSHVDANRHHRLDISNGNSLKSPSSLAAKNNPNANGIDSTRQPPPLFTNNFLRRGKRNDAPTSNESYQEEKPKKAQRITDASCPQKSSIEHSQRHGAGASQVRNGKAEATTQQTLRPDQVVSTKAKVDGSLKSATLPGVAAKESKVERSLKPETHSGFHGKEARVQSSSKSENHSSTASKEAKMEKSSKSESNSGIASKEVKVEKGSKAESNSGIAAKEAIVITSGVTSTNDSSTSSAKGQIEDRVRSQINASLCSKLTKVVETQPSAPTSIESTSERVQESEHVEFLSFPDPSVYQIRKEENLSSSLDLTVPSPPISFSHLERKVVTIIDKIQNFWKSGDFAVVNSFGSPVQ